MNQSEITAAMVFGGGEGGGSGSGDVTGVKGSAESSYKTGNVNISASNVGAYSSSEVDTALAGKVDWKSNGVLGAKNILPIRKSSGDNRGIAYTVNSDGTVTLDNGTATGGTSVFNIVSAGGFVGDKYAREFILSGTPSSLGSNNYCMQLRDGEDHVYYKGHEVIDTGDGVTVDFSKLTLSDSTPLAATNVRLLIRVASGVSGANGVFKPMLRITSDPDDTYVPYAMTNKELTEKVFEKRVLSSSDDLNDIKTTGIYGTTTSPTNAPESQTYGTLIVQATSSGDVRQLFWRAGGSGGLLYIRSYGGNPATWTSWFKFTGTAV